MAQEKTVAQEETLHREDATLPGLIVETPVGIPGYYYYDPFILQRELETFWYENWHIVGRVNQVQNPGDYLTEQIGNDPILVMRNEAGELQARLNVCAHRGMRLAHGSGNCQRFQCGYHGWKYDLDGKLKGVPYPSRFPPEIDKAKLGLVPAQVDTWGGFVFVKVAPGGPTLAESLGDMVNRWENYEVQWLDLSEVFSMTYEQNFNWKLFVENFIDYYHVPFIHPETLSMPDAVGNGAVGPHFKTTIEREGGRYNMFDHIFPNMFFHVSRRQVQFYRVVPQGPEACRMEIYGYQTPVQAAEYPLDSNEHRDLDKILAEDFGMCLMLQEQARSRAFQVIYTAQEFEEGVEHFYKMVTGRLADDLTKGNGR